MAKESLSEQAYRLIRDMIVRLELNPGALVRAADLQEQLEIGRTPIREALQRLARDQFLIVIPRRGMIVSNIDIAELSTLYETRAILEPYVARLACERGTADHWKQMRKVLDKAKNQATTAQDQIQFDAQCHEIVWEAAGNRFLTDTLDVLYAQSDRLWHMYLSDVADMGHALDEHDEILAALESGDSELVYKLSAAHVRSFDAQVRDAVRKRLELSVS
ncbi:MAG: GntR family transcriptional regulator [Acidimicrobiaceae bacterium]